MYPQLLRALGYYCSNRVKEDYNLSKNGKVWDDSSNKAHWRNRPAGMPFFAVFNSTKSHESQFRGHAKPPKTDVTRIRVPAYHPDTPEVRAEWGHYYDNISKVDADAGEMMRETKGFRLLEGYRNQPTGDVAALEETLLRVSGLISAVPELLEMDLNPVKVLEPGQGVVVVDARMRIRRLEPGKHPRMMDLPGVTS